MTSNPLVTCLCVTKNRREWLPWAIKCFEQQTYPERELVIVADTMADVSGLVHPADTVIFHPGKVGAKRNAGCAAALGEIICVWDDDDYSAPGRIASQVATLERTGKSVTGYKWLKFTEPATGKWWQYRGTQIAGTTLCFRKSFWEAWPFVNAQSGQDEGMATRAAACRPSELVMELDLDLMYATNHPGNTCPRDLAVKNTAVWKPLPGFVWADPAEAKCAA